MSFFYGDIKTDELETANGLILLKETGSTEKITLNCPSAIGSSYKINFPATIGSAGNYLKIDSIIGTSNVDLTFAPVSSALDDISEGDALSNLTTSAGTITIYPQADDLIMKTVTGKKIKGIVNAIDVLELYDNGANITGKVRATDNIRTISNLEANTGLNIGPNYSEFALTGSATHQSIASTTTGNIDFKLNTSNTVMRLQGSSNSVLIPGTSKVFFRDTNSNINSSTSGTLNLDASTTMNFETATINFKATDVSNDGNFTNKGTFKLGTNSNELEITNSSGDITMDISTTDKDLIFTVNDGGSADTEVMRLDGSESSLLIATDKKIQLRDTATYIQSSALNTINITAPTLDINASTEVNIDNDVKIGGKLYLGTNQNELEISESTDNITIKNTITDADITFNLSDGGTATDMLKLDASDNVVIATNMNTSNTFSISQLSNTISGTTTKVLDFSTNSDFIISVSGNSTLTLAKINANRVGQQGSIIITQSSDTNSLTWATSNGWYFPSATAPTLSVGNGYYDVFSYLVVASDKILVMDATNFQAY